MVEGKRPNAQDHFNFCSDDIVSIYVAKRG